MIKNRLVIIDAHALIHRAYHAIPPLTTKEGEVVNAVYGFSMFLLSTLKKLDPEYIAVAFDLPGKTKRHEKFADYKAHRKEKPDDFAPQIKRVEQIVESFSIPAFTHAGYEADDIIGTIAKNVPKEIKTYIVTGDMDELQLVDKNIRVFTMKRGFSDTVIYDIQAVKEKYGFGPENLVDYKALRGDPSDNIPGVAGVGDKTATDLVKEFKTIEKVYKNIEKIKPTVAKKLETDKKMAELSKILATIKTDLKIEFDLEKCRVSDFNKNKVYDLFQELGFKSLISRLPKSEGKEQEERKHLEKTNYKLVRNKKELSSLISKLGKSKRIAIDTETTSKDQIDAKLVGISFSVKEGEAFYIPVAHEEKTKLEKSYVINELKQIVENENIGKIGHNIKYDYVVLKKEGLEIKNILFDTMIAAYLESPNLRAQKLSDLAFSELGIKMTDIEDYIGKGKNQLTFNNVKLTNALTYAAEDADITLRLAKLLEKSLKKLDLLDLAKKIEFPLISILGDMELIGIKVDKEKLRKLSKETKKEIILLEKQIHKTGEKKFNISSPIQLQEILFNKLKVHEKIKDPRDLRRLKNGGYSTAASELEKLKDVHPIINNVFRYRELSKLKNTYIDALPKLIKKDLRIHTSYNQAITQTGRLSSSNPNLQNIPTRTKEGRKIKSAFIAEKGNVLLSADYSQIELRVIAHIAKDKEMIDVFESGRDIHTETASGLYDVPEKKVTKEMRRAAKIVNFGIIYGVSAHGLHQQVKVTREEGQRLINKYFELHPNIKKYSEKVINQAKELGYVETIFGRRRLLPEIHSKNFAVRGAAERMAINMPVQGTAADLMKLAMIDITKGLSGISKTSKMLLQVHDELILEVPEKEIDKVSKFIKKKMNNVVSLSVPIETSVHWGKTWEKVK